MKEELEHAQKLLEEERTQRATQCQAALDQVLKKFNCKLDVAMILRPSKTPEAVMRIVAE